MNFCNLSHKITAHIQHFRTCKFKQTELVCFCRRRGFVAYRYLSLSKNTPQFRVLAEQGMGRLLPETIIVRHPLARTFGCVCKTIMKCPGEGILFMDTLTGSALGRYDTMYAARENHLRNEMSSVLNRIWQFLPKRKRLSLHAVCPLFGLARKQCKLILRHCRRARKDTRFFEV